MITEEKVIAICDISDVYVLDMADKLAQFIRKPYVIYTFTSLDAVDIFLKKRDIYLLIVSELAMRLELVDSFEDTTIEKVFLLRDGNMPDSIYPGVDKYRPYEEVIQKIMAYITEQEDYISLAGERRRGWKVVGFYSPIKRCLQSTFALSLGQLLAETKKVLYMSFENVPVISGYQNRNMQGDITDLLYYFDCDSDKFIKKLPLLTKSINGMDYLPPSQSYFDTYDRTGKRWIEFFEMLEKHTEYDVLLLDLTDGMPGLLDVLEYCDKLYTIGKEDALAKAKMQQYEDWMKQHAFAEIMEKTIRLCLPVFENLPEDVGLLAHGELSKYARAVIREDLCG